MSDRRHVMFLHAHPDDESSKGAATMAAYARRGDRVSVLTFTDGCEGDILNPALADDASIKENLKEIRKKEIAQALAILAVTDHFDLDYPDSGYHEEFSGSGWTTSDVLGERCFYNVPMPEIVARVVPIIRETRPQVLVTYDEKGGYPHPDHIRTHTATMAAWYAAADPAFMPEAGPAWKASKIYYHMGFTYTRLKALHDAALERGMESPFAEWLERWDTSRPERITTQVEVDAELIALRNEALRAHRTQIDPDGAFFALPDDLVAEIYPHEDYVLARSEVPTTLPEADLFDGLD